MKKTKKNLRNLRNQKPKEPLDLLEKPKELVPSVPQVWKDQMTHWFLFFEIGARCCRRQCKSWLLKSRGLPFCCSFEVSQLNCSKSLKSAQISRFTTRAPPLNLPKSRGLPFGERRGGSGLLLHCCHRLNTKPEWYNLVCKLFCNISAQIHTFSRHLKCHRKIS